MLIEIYPQSLRIAARLWITPGRFDAEPTMYSLCTMRAKYRRLNPLHSLGGVTLTMLFLTSGAVGIVQGSIVLPAVALPIGALLLVGQALLYLYARGRSRNA